VRDAGLPGRPLSAAVCEEVRALARAGVSVSESARRVGCSSKSVYRVLRRGGGIAPGVRRRSLRALTVVEREEISRGLRAELSFRQIALVLGRSVSTVAREVAANRGRERYRAVAAQRRALRMAARPKQAKLAMNGVLAVLVEEKLLLFWSPQQISAWLRLEFPHDPGMQVSHETIYQSLYVQGRGALRRELAACLRDGRAYRRLQGSRRRGGAPIDGRILISERPADVADRAVPGHWEGDLIVGKNAASQIGTLVERQTRYVQLVALPDGKSGEQVAAALTRQVQTLPASLRRTLTWDQGSEMAQHAQFTIATDVKVYFCDPHSPWQRGTNENTNRLLRQWFRKGTDLSHYTQDHLNTIADLLNNRPRQTLGWMTPSAAFNELVSQ